MIRLGTPGERGGELTLTLTPFDLLSLQEACSASVRYYEESLEEYLKDKPTPNRAQEDIANMLRYKIKDARANYGELENALNVRNEILG